MLTLRACRRRIVRGAAAVWIAVAAAPAQQPVQAPVTRQVDIDGYAMRVQTIGLDRRRQGGPVVVFEAGATQGLDAWGEVLSRVVASAPVIAYDRAGLGQSQWDSVPPTPHHVTTRLRRLLTEIGVEPPYVLVGYSWGGMLARYFASGYPTDVMGLVFVDPAPMITQSLEDNLTPFAAVGAGRAGFDAFWSGYAGFFTRAPPAVRAEFEVFRTLLTTNLADRDLRPLPDVPLVVLIAARYLPPPPTMQLPYDPRAQFDADVRYRTRVLQEWTLASPKGTLVTTNHTTHALPREDPDLIVWAVRRVLGTAGNRP